MNNNPESRSASRWLAGLTIRDFVATQREKGRRRLTDEFKARWSVEHVRAVAYLRDNRPRGTLRRVLELLREVTYPINAASGPEGITYYTYTDVGVLDWFLSGDTTFRGQKFRAVRGAFALIRDLYRFETESLAGVETRHAEQLDRVAVTHRIETIRELLQVCGNRFLEVGLPGPDEANWPALATLSEYAAGSDRMSALLHLSLFPQTQSHDEVVFLRTVHVGELCFYALRVTAQESIEYLQRGRLVEAAHCLRQATAVAVLLDLASHVLNTMAPEHFLSFREYTERGSAVQSRNYQLLDVTLRGVDHKKVAIYGQTRPLEDLARFRHPSFLSLRAALDRSELRELNGWDQVEAAARTLDRQLLEWRGLHIHFAVKYLGGKPTRADGPGKQLAATGGTTGYPYLAQFLREGLFKYTDEDWAGLVESIHDLNEFLAARPVSPPDHIAPPLHYRGLSGPDVSHCEPPPAAPNVPSTN